MTAAVALTDVIQGCAAIGVEVFVDRNGALAFSAEPARRYEADLWNGHRLAVHRSRLGWRAFVDGGNLPGIHAVSTAMRLARAAVGAPYGLRWHRRS